MPTYATVAVPDARKYMGHRDAKPHDEVRALLGIIRRSALSPSGRSPSRDQIAALLGIAPSTLDAYIQAPRKRVRNSRGVPYTVIYALEVLAACPHGAAERIWSDDADSRHGELE